MVTRLSNLHEAELQFDRSAEARRVAFNALMDVFYQPQGRLIDTLVNDIISSFSAH